MVNVYGVKKNIDVSAIILYMVCCFPFVKLIPALMMKTDTQPYAICYSIILCAFIIGKSKKIRISRDFFWICFNAFFFGCIIFFSQNWLPKTALSANDVFSTIRNIASIASMMIITYASYLIFSKVGFNERYIKISINIYLIIALIQKYVKADFLYEIIAGTRTTANRGVISLTAEPSFYAYICFFLLFFVYDFKKRKILYIINLIFQIVFLAESSVGCLYLAVLGCILILKRILLLDIKKLIPYIICGMFVMAGVVSLMYYFSVKMQNRRIGMFISIFFSGRNLNQIWQTLLYDASIAERLFHITESLGAFWSDYGMPHGFNAIRIESGFGTLLYQYGIIGVIILYLIVKIIKNNYVKDELGNTFACVVFIVMFSAIQLTSTILWFYIGYCLSGCRKGHNRGVNKDGKFS